MVLEGGVRSLSTRATPKPLWTDGEKPRKILSQNRHYVDISLSVFTIYS